MIISRKILIVLLIYPPSKEFFTLFLPPVTLWLRLFHTGCTAGCRKVCWHCNSRFLKVPCIEIIESMFERKKVNSSSESNILLKGFWNLEERQAGCKPPGWRWWGGWWWCWWPGWRWRWLRWRSGVSGRACGTQRSGRAECAATADLRTDGTGRGKPSHAGHEELQSYRVQRSLQHTGRPRYRKLFSTASHSSGLVGDKL